MSKLRVWVWLVVVQLGAFFSGAQPFVEVGTTIPGTLTMNLDWGDYDNDGDLDLARGEFMHQQMPNLRLFNQQSPLAFAAANISVPSQYSIFWGDYDADGWLDFFATRSTLAGWDSWIYRNNRQGGFEKRVRIDAPPATTFVQWGDYDNDGDLDLLLGGFQEIESKVQIWRNEAPDIFIRVPISFPASYYAEGQFVDLDNDGWLDLFLQGDDITYGAGTLPVIYRNNKDGTFSRASDLGFIYQMEGADFADYDRDGDLDGIVQGVHLGQPATRILRNDGSFQFTLISSPMDSHSGASPRWGDFDNNGTIDAFIATTVTETNNSYRIFSASSDQLFTDTANAWGFPEDIYLNLSRADLDNNGTLDLFTTGLSENHLYRNDAANRPPQPPAPVELGATVNGNDVRLNWAAPVTSGTRAYTYNVRVGRSAGGSDVVAAMADATTGFRRIVANGNAGTRNFSVLRLPAGRYYWSVQTVDERYLGSAFAAEQEFTVGPGLPLLQVVQVSTVSNTEARFAGMANANGAESLVWFEYGVGEGFDLMTAPAALPIQAGYKQFTATASGLPLNKEMSVRLVASNEFGVVRGPATLFVTANTPPSIELSGTKLTSAPGVRSGEILITVSDLESAPGQIELKAEAVRNGVVLPANVFLAATGPGQFTLSVQPEMPGESTITLTVSDRFGGSSQTTVAVASEYFSSQPGPRPIALGDFNRDGLLDMVHFGTGSTAASSLLTNLGGFTFGNHSTLATRMAAGHFEDFNRDGVMDLAVISQQNVNFSGIYFGTTEGNFPGPSIPLPFISQGALDSADFDLDGSPDLVAVGLISLQNALAPGPVKVLQSIGSNVPTTRWEVTPGTIRFMQAAVAVGDVNNDQRPDFIVSGSTNSSRPPVTVLYVNRAPAVFSETVLAGVFGVQSGSLQLGDIDHDGDLDLVMAGNTNTTQTPRWFMDIFRNDGNGAFTSSRLRSTPLRNVSLGIGDYDNDGDFDFVLNGDLDSFPRFMQVYRNDREFGFNVIPGVPIPPSASGSIGTAPNYTAWGDIDRDGDLDIAVAGISVAGFMRNNLESADELPAIPGRLRVEQAGLTTALAWDAPPDFAARMPLSYNLRVGRGPGKDDVVPALAEPGGRRSVVRAGNAGQHGSRRLENLPPGRYFWSVQSIEPSYAGSPFAPEATFIITESGLYELRITSVTSDAAGGLTIGVNSSLAGEVIVEVSVDLRTWTQKATFEVPAGDSNLTVEGEGGSRFYRAAFRAGE